jgi:hypothetical protein
MSSKYDPFWTARLEQIRDGIQLASTRGRAVIPLSGLRAEGERQSWHGTADVRGNQVARSWMAHATSLARIVASSGICEQWPERTIRFAIGAAGHELTISVAARAGEVVSRVRALGGQECVQAFWDAKRGVHDPVQGDLRLFVEDTERLTKELRR